MVSTLHALECSMGKMYSSNRCVWVANIISKWVLWLELKASVPHPRYDTQDQEFPINKWGTLFTTL
ncbi:hypothetical protein BJV82DRAFT_596054, partial [Fennellomyces sp. T-0311]